MVVIDKSYIERSDNMAINLYKGTYDHRRIWNEYYPNDIALNGEVIHHINGDKKDNRISNLYKMPVDKHIKLHHKGKKRSRRTKLRMSKEFRNTLNYRKIWNNYYPYDLILKDEVIHHIDGSKSNNDISNLRKMSISAHVSLHRKGSKSSEDTKRRSSASHKGYIVSTVTRKLLSKRLMGHKVSDETRLKISKASMGKKMSEESKKKMSVNNGMKNPDVVKRMLRSRRLNKLRTILN
tara:strand:- start:124 stop:834 length:711 start_codon:yes stop_codon:yes gene_type:complete